MLSNATATLEWIPLEALTASIQPRSLRTLSVARLVESMKRSGFLPQYPIVVSVLNDGYRLLAGHHRVTAAQQLGIATVPALLYTELTSDEEWQLAVATNRAHEAATLPTFVDDAELVWKLIETGRKQEEVASIMAWSRAQVSQYTMLKNITTEAWQLIATTFEVSGSMPQTESVAEMLPLVATQYSVFNERLLRDIVQLTAPQQLSLVKLVLKDPKAKAEYRKQAEKYKAQNALVEEAQRRLKSLPPELLDRALGDIEKGIYNSEWLMQKMPGERFNRLMQQLLDEYAKKQNYTLYHGRFEEIAAGVLEPESLDVIITDPPYGKDAVEGYKHLAEFAAHYLKPGGNCFVMCGQTTMLDMADHLRETLTFHHCLAYDLPGGQATYLHGRGVNVFWKPIWWFVKGAYVERKALGDKVKSAMNDNDKRYHEWGQSESGMLDLVERVTEKGELVCDPYMGAGTTGIVALRLSRKFIGIEADADTFAIAMQRFQEQSAL